MADVVVCGAGIAGVATAFHLTRAGVSDVVVVDPLPPLTLTSDKSTECYRNWWPSQPMVQLMNRSIELLDRYAAETGNAFALNRKGYLYVTASAATLEEMAASARQAEAFGAGELRVHSQPNGYEPGGRPGGADLFTTGPALLHHFPYLAGTAVGGLHARTAGWLSAQQLGMWMLDEAVAAGASLVTASVTAVEVEADTVRGVALDNGATIPTRAFVNAAGPLLPAVGRMVDVDLPVFSELHAKSVFRDHRGAVPRAAPMIIWADPQRLPWSDEERDLLVEEGKDDLLGTLPAGCHARPEGGGDSPWIIGLWEYGAREVEPTWPLPLDPMYTEMVLRGLTTMVPSLSVYEDNLPEASVDGGYYTKTVENLPLAGPAGPKGSYVCGALSGFGVMAACAVGEIVATAIAGDQLPDWTHHFDLRRYDDPAYVASLQDAGSTGQL